MVLASDCDNMGNIKKCNQNPWTQGLWVFAFVRYPLLFKNFIVLQ